MGAPSEGSLVVSRIFQAYLFQLTQSAYREIDWATAQAVRLKFACLIHQRIVKPHRLRATHNSWDDIKAAQEIDGSYEGSALRLANQYCASGGCSAKLPSGKAFEITVKLLSERANLDVSAVPPATAIKPSETRGKLRGAFPKKTNNYSRHDAKVASRDYPFAYKKQRDT